MWLLIVFVILLVFGPTRRVIVAIWKFSLPMLLGAVVGWELGKFVFDDFPGFWWVPWAWAVILGVLFAKTIGPWLNGMF